jgi:hypothetical protein
MVAKVGIIPPRGRRDRYVTIVDCGVPGRQEWESQRDVMDGKLPIADRNGDWQFYSEIADCSLCARKTRSTE